MTNVVLVCAAGVSGTFLARRMRTIDPQLSPVVTTATAFESVVPSADVVLIAPQLAGDADAIRRVSGGVPAILLPAAAYGIAGAEIAVRAVHDALASVSAAYRDSSPTPMKE